VDFFEVDKDSDIRLFYNGTSCGLNNALWAPNFFLPTPATVARALGFGYYMIDINLGEMFLNFPLHETFQRYPEALESSTKATTSPTMLAIKESHFITIGIGAHRRQDLQGDLILQNPIS
jgi:hypothetical protein